MVKINVQEKREMVGIFEIEYQKYMLGVCYILSRGVEMYHMMTYKWVLPYPFLCLHMCVYCDD